MGCIVLVRCVLVLRCGLAGVVWYPDAGWSLVSGCRLQPASGYHTTPAKPHRNTNTHRTRTIYPWNNSINKSQAPEDGCTNIRNMLSIKQWNNEVSDIKLVYLYSSILCFCWPCILVQLWVNDQLDAQLRYIKRLLFQSSTCFEQHCAHHQEVESY